MSAKGPSPSLKAWGPFNHQWEYRYFPYHPTLQISLEANHAKPRDLMVEKILNNRLNAMDAVGVCSHACNGH